MVGNYHELFSQGILLMKKLKYLAVGLAVLVVVVYFGLPRALVAMGLHPHYEIPPFDLEGRRVLIVATNQGTLGDTGKATGVFASEVTGPYYAFLAAGLDVDIASISGGKIPIEPVSSGWPVATASDYKFWNDAIAMDKLGNSMPVVDVEISDFDAVFLAGGFGAAYDFAQSAELGVLISQANANGAVLGAVCHGVLGLMQANNPDGTPLIAGRTVTGITDLQAKQLGYDITPKHPEAELRAAEADYEFESAFWDMFASHVSVDGNLVTGQNQNSAMETAHRILELLDNQN